MNTTIGTDIAHAAALLHAGEVVAVPTETVYGLAANALSPDAVVKIFEAKNRPFFDPLIVHIPDITEIGKYVHETPSWAASLAAVFSPGAITYLLPKKDLIPDIVTSGLDRVGIRIPSHSLIRSLLQELDFPLAAPSANPFGYISPTTAQHVYDQLQGKIPYILDGGPSDVGVESTIIGEEDGKLIIYRLGGVSVEGITRIVGDVELRTSNSKPSAPGSLESHYAPKAKLRIVENGTDIHSAGKTAYIGFQHLCNEFSVSDQRVLSSKADLHEAAKNLFLVMRELDTLGYETIYAELAPETGLGRAINDRLKRAAAKG